MQRRVVLLRVYQRSSCCFLAIWTPDHLKHWELFEASEAQESSLLVRGIWGYSHWKTHERVAWQSCSLHSWELHARELNRVSLAASAGSIFEASFPSRWALAASGGSLVSLFRDCRWTGGCSQSIHRLSRRECSVLASPARWVATPCELSVACVRLPTLSVSSRTPSILDLWASARLHSLCAWPRIFEVQVVSTRAADSRWSSRNFSRRMSLPLRVVGTSNLFPAAISPSRSSLSICKGTVSRRWEGEEITDLSYCHCSLRSSCFFFSAASSLFLSASISLLSSCICASRLYSCRMMFFSFSK